MPETTDDLKYAGTSGKTIKRLAITFTNDDVIFVNPGDESIINRSGLMRAPGWRQFRDYGPPDHLRHEYQASDIPPLAWWNMDKVVSIHEVEGVWGDE